jgi:CheY-like chemotaxis protein
MFCVSDSGIGISKDKQQLIFERFRQLDDSYLTREYGGVGLGLSICKGLIELMNGSIWVESEPEKGSVFFFTIPYIPTNRIDTEQDIAKSVSYDFSGKTILIVEDVAYNQEYLREILKDTNATLIFADNGVSAIEEFRLHTAIDVVLMDIRLPDINGLELTKNMIKERKNIKIIAQTAYASNSDREKAIDAGCNDYISKPINRGLLLDIISKQLNK